MLRLTRVDPYRRSGLGVRRPRPHDQAHSKAFPLSPIISPSQTERAQGKPMAEDEETATARYIASNISTQLMLKTIFEIIVTMADDPDKYRARLKAKLFELADTMPLAEMAPGAGGQGSRVRA
jgi:hypothetical protein